MEFSGVLFVWFVFVRFQVFVCFGFVCVREEHTNITDSEPVRSTVKLHTFGTAALFSQIVRSCKDFLQRWSREGV